MINVTQQPGSIAFSRNPMIYGLQSDNLYQSPGQAFIGLLTFADFANNGEGDYYFNLSYGGNNLQFYVGFSTDDPDSGYTLPPIDDGAGFDFANWLPVALERLQANYYLQRDFTLDLFSNTGGRTTGIRFTAKQIGDQYQVTSDTAAQITAYNHPLVVMSSLQQGLSNQPRPNFKIMIEVWMKLPDGSDFERLSQAFPDVDDTGSCTYDVSGTISDGLAAYGFDRPNLAVANADVCLNSVRQYYLQIAEVFGSDQVIRAVAQTTTKVAMYGGFSKRLMQELAYPGYFVNGDTVNFLDQELPVKTTHLRQPEFLTFCWFNAGNTAAKLRVIITYSDNTTNQIPDQFYTASVAQYAKISYPTGYSQLGLGNYDITRNIVSWTAVLLNDQDVAITETKTYVIDYTYRPYGRYLLYQNSFGGYISAFTYGKSSREYELTFQSSEITPKGGFNLIDGERLNFNQVADDKTTLVTGFMSRRQLLTLRDLILSVDKFLIDKGVALPIGILSSSIKEFKDGDNLYSQSFDINFQWSEQVYTYDPDEVSPYSPEDISNYTPVPLDPEQVENFDDRYYLKTLTYSAVQVDGLIANEATARAAGDANLQNQITDINTDLATKMDDNQNFDGRYYTQGQINTMLAGIQNQVTAEAPSGNLGGNNTIFILAQVPKLGTEKVFLNGMRMKATIDYTIAGAMITMLAAPGNTDILLVDYTY